MKAAISRTQLAITINSSWLPGHFRNQLTKKALVHHCKRFALRRRFSSVSPDTGCARFSQRVLRSEIEKLSEKLSRGPEQMAALRDLWRRASRPTQTRLRKNSRRIILDRALRDKRAMYRAGRSEMTVSEIAGRNSARKFVLFPSLASYALNASNSPGRSIDRSIESEAALYETNPSISGWNQRFSGADNARKKLNWQAAIVYLRANEVIIDRAQKFAGKGKCKRLPIK